MNEESTTTARVVSILALLVISVGAYFYMTTPSAAKKKYVEKKQVTQVDIGGEFELTNLDGKSENTKTYEGKYRLVYFGFTYCPDICPSALNIMSHSLDILDKYGADIVPIFVTIDPSRDTPEVLKPYLQHFNKKIIGYTGSEIEIKKVADQFKVFYAKVPRPEHTEKDYLLDHSSFFYFLDKNGNYIQHFASTTSPEEIANSIFKEIRLRAEKG